MTHTPGPWTAFYKPKYDEWHVSLPSGSGMKMALCPDGIQSGNREDDARLIASAPDMLAALKGLLAAVDKMDMPPHAGGGVLPTDKALATHAARAAISKAEGK